MPASVPAETGSHRLIKSKNTSLNKEEKYWQGNPKSLKINKQKNTGYFETKTAWQIMWDELPFDVCLLKRARQISMHSTLGTSK